MSESAVPYQELLALCVALSDGSISDADFARLDALLAADPQARAFYLEFMRTSAMLEQRAQSQAETVIGDGDLAFSMSDSDSDSDLWTLKDVGDLLAPPKGSDSLVDLTDELARRKRAQKQAARERLRALEESRRGHADAGAHHPFVIPKSVAWLGFAAAVLFAVVLVAINTRKPPVDSSIATRPAPQSGPDVPASVATLTYVDRAVWSGRRGPISIHSRVAPGPLRLESGVAHFVLDSGAVVMLRGPVEIDLTSQWEAWLSEGQLVARVPEMAHGFRVRGEGFVVTDLGTEFAVRVDDADVQCRVILGEVELATPEREGSRVTVERLRENRLVGVDRATGAVTDLDPAQADDIAWALPYTAQLNQNLVVNGDFEDGAIGVAHSFSEVDDVVIPGWDNDGPATVIGYEQAGVQADVGFPNYHTDAVPDDRGEAFYFAHGQGTTTQAIDLSMLAPLTDKGMARVSFAADLGGYITQDDHIRAAVVFLDAAGRELSRGELERVDVQARQGRTGFIHRSTQGMLPVGTRRARIELHSIYSGTGLADGFADNVSLVIETHTPETPASSDATSDPSTQCIEPPPSAAWSQGGGHFLQTGFLLGASCDVSPGFFS